MNATRRSIILAAAAIPILKRADAAPPPGADPAMGPFFHSLRLESTADGYCCSSADCRAVETKQEDGKLFVWIDKKTFKENAPPVDDWYEVTPDLYAVNPLENVPRPLTAVACVYEGKLRCFTPPVPGG